MCIKAWGAKGLSGHAKNVSFIFGRLTLLEINFVFPGKIVNLPFSKLIQNPSYGTDNYIITKNIHISIYMQYVRIRFNKILYFGGQIIVLVPEELNHIWSIKCKHIIRFNYII